MGIQWIDSAERATYRFDVLIAVMGFEDVVNVVVVKFTKIVSCAGAQLANLLAWTWQRYHVLWCCSPTLPYNFNIR